jgi:hypothetical protein
VTARAAVLGFLLPLAGCILFVSPGEYGGACRFGAADSACTACVRDKCQPSVDACCTDDACGPSLTLLDACASGDPKACQSLNLDAQSTVATKAALGQCVAAQCRSACPVGSTKSRTKCDTPLFGGQKTCSCTISAESNDTVCSAAAFPDTICCAADGWPGPSLRCSCLTLGCAPSQTGCLCGLFDSSSDEHTCTATYCCASKDVCACGSTPCESGETRVATCDLGAVTCPVGQSRVDSCSVPIP